MLLPTQIKSLLLHKSPAVRELAASFFNDRDDHDPDLVNLAAEAVRQHGFANVAEAISQLEFAPTTSEAWNNQKWLWSQTGDQRVHADDPLSVPFQSILAKGMCRAPTDWVRQDEAELRSQSKVEHTSWDVVAAREEWSGWTPEQRWEHLKNYAAAWDKEDEFPREVDGPFVEMLLEAIAQSPVPSNAEIEAGISEFENQEDNWLEVLLVRLAGWRRIEAVVPRLVDLLGADDDAMPSSAQRALIKIGTDAVVHQIAERFPGEEWSWQLYATGVLETIGLPSSEETLLSLCEQTLRSGNEAMFGSALLRQFSERSIPVLRQFVLDGYDGALDTLEDSLHVVAQVLGVEFSLDAAWQSSVERCQAERDASWKAFREAFREKQQDQSVRDGDLMDDDNFNAPPISTGTFVRGTVKVGRNDPCSCGSGKKFKKCCGVIALRSIQ